VSIEFDGRTRAVRVRQLEGEERAAAWKHITTVQPRFAGYETRTDRELPVLRLVPSDAG
jgi:hypothetical protein